MFKKAKLKRDNFSLTIDDYKQLIGKEIKKISGKPFKSLLKINTVKDIIFHPITKKPAYTFYEDDSYVECFVCISVK